MWKRTTSVRFAPFVCRGRWIAAASRLDGETKACRKGAVCAILGYARVFPEMLSLRTRARSPVLTASALKWPAAGAAVAAGLRSQATPASAGCARMIPTAQRWTSLPPQSHWARVGLQHPSTRRYSFATPQYDSAFGGQDLRCACRSPACVQGGSGACRDAQKHAQHATFSLLTSRKLTADRIGAVAHRAPGTRQSRPAQCDTGIPGGIRQGAMVP